MRQLNLIILLQLQLVFEFEAHVEEHLRFQGQKHTLKRHLHVLCS